MKATISIIIECAQSTIEDPGSQGAQVHKICFQDIVDQS